MACSLRLVSLAFVGSVVSLLAVACGGGGDDAAQGGDQAISASTSHNVFTCDLSSGDATTGENFKLTLGVGTATVESSDLGKHTGKVQKNAPSVPSTSERYLISGLADDGVTGLVIPKDIRTETRATVHIESTSAQNKTPNSFLCHPVDDSAPAPSSGRGGGTAGSQSGVKGTLNLTCKVAANQDESFGDEVDIVLKADDTLSIKGTEIDGNGPFDKAFKPTGNTAFVRYLVDGLFDEAATDVLIEKPILTGKGGRLKIEAKGETFTTSTFNCTTK